MQLFLLHFAGGNCYSYDFLLKNIKAKTTIDCYALELPGRGKRYGEQLLMDKETAINDYISQIRSKRNGDPYILYGHSMGAILGFHVIQKMEETKDAPVAFIATGNSGPGVKDKGVKGTQKKYLLNDDEFKEYLRKLGGIQEEVLTNKELYEFFSPIMRADFQILEENNMIPEKQINTLMHVLMGNQEEHVEEIHNWEKYTRTKPYTEVLGGNHFFIYNHHEKLMEIILKIADSFCIKK